MRDRLAGPGVPLWGKVEYGLPGNVTDRNASEWKLAMSKLSHPINLSLLRTTAAGLICLLGAPLALAQETGLLDEVRRAETIATQKLERDVTAALAEADKLGRESPIKGIDRLRIALLSLDDEEPGVPRLKKEAAARQLKNRIRTFELEMARVFAGAEDREKKQAAAQSRRADNDRLEDEVAGIKARLELIRKLQEDGKPAQAAKEAKDLAGAKEQTPATQASQEIASTRERVSAAKKAGNEQSEGLFQANLDMSRSAIPPGGELTFPKDWVEKTKKRTDSAPLSAKERAILKALASPIEVNFKNTRLEEALEYLHRLTGQNILLDQASLKEVDATYDSPVTMHAKNVSLRSVLKKILADVGLSYVVKEETIQVVTPGRARGTMVTKRYYIGDLLATMNTMPPINGNGFPLVAAPSPRPFITPYGMVGIAFGGNVPAQTPAVTEATVAQNQVQMLANVKGLIEMIKNSCDANSWDGNGGQGSISFHLPTMSLIIRQTAEMHALMGTGLLE